MTSSTWSALTVSDFTVHLLSCLSHGDVAEEGGTSQSEKWLVVGVVSAGRTGQLLFPLVSSHSVSGKE